MYQLLSLVSILATSYMICRLQRCAGMVDRILIYFLLVLGQVVATGYLLSWLHRLDSVAGWAMCGLCFTLPVFLFAISRESTRRTLFSLPHLPELNIGRWYGMLSRFQKLLLWPMAIIVLLLGISNLALVLFCAPHNCDSMTYHLVRMAHYLQQGSLDNFEANYWAQVVHPKSSTILLLYSFLASGGNENLTQGIQFLSYWIVAVAVYGITRNTGQSRTAAIFAALCFALLIECLMQASTTQNDMILAALTATAVYFSYRCRGPNHRIGTLWVALSIGLAAGIKASFFLVLPVILMVVYANQPRGSSHPMKTRLIHRFNLGLLILVFGFIFTLPSGYLENSRIYGHPMGPERIRKIHTFTGRPPAFVAVNGTKNLFRFGFDAASLETPIPFYPQATAWQTNLLRQLGGCLKTIGLDLETRPACRVLFTYGKFPRAHEDRAYWGVLGFGLAVPVMLLTLGGAIRGSRLRLLSAATVLFLLIQAYSGPYDPWRGRYFVMCAIFALPVLGVCVNCRSRFLQGYLLVVVFLACFSAVSAVTLRSNRALITWRQGPIKATSVFTMDRTGQLTSNRKWCHEQLIRFDRLVHRNARLAVALGERSYEYPLFGEGLTRTVIPINSFNKGLQRVPGDAQYLIFSSQVIPVRPGDHHLAQDRYLRHLP